MKTPNLIALAAVVMFPVASLGGVTGSCTEIEQDVMHQEMLWDSFQVCAPAPSNATFDRIAIHVGKPDQPAKLDFNNPPHFVCHNPPDQKVIGTFKAHEKFFACANGDECFPGGPPCADGSPCLELNNHEVWSGNFDEVCQGKVSVYLKIAPSRPPGWKVVIKEADFECRDSGGCPKPVPTVSEWGIASLGLLLIVGLTIKFGALRFRKAA